MQLRRSIVVLAALLIVGALSGCTLLDEIAGGLAEVCEADPLVVNKTADTDDSLCTSDDCSLRDAILTANSCPGTQTIEVPAGNYSLTIEGSGEDEAHRGDLDILDPLTLRGTGGEVVIDAGRIDRAFHIIDEFEDAPVMVSFEDLIVQGGLGEFTGGGIYHEQGWLSLNGVTVRDNQAGIGGTAGGAGGGIYTEDHLTTFRSRIEGNEALGPGGGLYVSESGSLLANDALVVTDNIATGGDGGGGIFNRGEVIFMGEITNNEAAANGAGIWNGGDLEMRNATISANSEAIDGGGLYNNAGGTVIVYESWFNNNSAGVGGAVYNQGMVHLYQSGVNTNAALDGFGGGLYNDGEDSALLLQNTTVSDNQVVPPGDGGGSGIYNAGGDLRIEFSTVVYNNADGIFNEAGQGTLENSILAYHSDGNCSGDRMDSRGHNLSSDASCELDESTDLEETDPQLSWLALNGGSSLNHLPNPGSPAIDSGDRDTCIAEDQRGVSRPQGDWCDRGAVEARVGEESDSDLRPTPLAAEIDVNFNADSYSVEEGECTTLRWAVIGADTVNLLGQERELTEAQEVCPDETSGYTLIAENEVNQVQSFLEIEVTEPTDDSAPAMGCTGFDDNGQLVCKASCGPQDPGDPCELE